MKYRQKTVGFMKRSGTLLAMALGLLLLAVVYVGQTDRGRSNVEEMMRETLSFVKNQCIMYDNFKAGDIAKSQIRLADTAKELSRCLDGADLISEESLEEYAQEQRLDGIIVLDKNLDAVGEYSRDGSGYAAWESIIRSKNIRSICDYPQKIYVARLDKAYDYAAVSRRGQDGIVFVYTCLPTAVMAENRFTIENVMTGYKMEMDGVVLVTDGERVLSTNENTFRGETVSDSAFFQPEIFEGHSSGLVRVRVNGKLYYGGTAKANSYQLYVFYPLSEVFAQRRNVILYTLLVYAVFCMALLFMSNWSTRNYLTQLNQSYEKELEYQKKLEKAIEEAERANAVKTDFLRRMSHDIRTPINGIRGMVEIGNHFPEDMEKQRECREKIWQTSGFLLELVNEVMDMNKLESGRIQLEEVPFDLTDLLQEVKTIIEVQAAERGIAFSLNTDGIAHRNLIGSPLHLRQVILNVVSNAVKYNKEHGSAAVSCREISSDSERAEYEFVCTDTGIGIAEEFQEHMFEPFAQENAVLRTSYMGTGLGLAIVKSLVEHMGGTIQFDSVKGQGTTFSIVLSFRLDPEPPVQEETQEEDDSLLAGIRILLVEDNELNMEIAEFILEDANAEITKAWNGQEAAELFAASEPGTYQVILMDLMMPVMDGLAAARAIRSMDREDAKTVVIIAMTANSFADDVERCREAGMDGHLSKPLDFAGVIKEIRSRISGTGKDAR